MDIEGGMEEDQLTFPSLIDGLSAPIATLTADGHVELVNRQLLDYLGKSVEELKDWQTAGVVHPDDLPRILTVWNQSLERGEPYQLEQRVRRADGVYQWVQVWGLPLRDTRNRVARWCVLLTDIAERKRFEALLDGEKRLLEMVASGSHLEDVLEAMCGIVDAVVDDSVCSILLIQSNGTFRHGAGPNGRQMQSGTDSTRSCAQSVGLICCRQATSHRVGWGQC
jgi:PAS domain S-box-containing protein